MDFLEWHLHLHFLKNCLRMEMKEKVKEILFFLTGNTVAVTLAEVEQGSQDGSWKLMH